MMATGNPKAASVRLTRMASSGQRSHDFRTGHQPSYVDPTRSKDNSVLAPAPPWEDVCATAVALRARRQPPFKRPLKRTASRAWAGVITLGADVQPRFEALSRKRQNEAMRAAARAISEAASSPLLWAVVHRDESAPHLHFALSSFCEDGVGMSAHMSRRRLSTLQDTLREALLPWLPDLERGHRKTTTSAPYRTPTEMRAALVGPGPASTKEVAAAVEQLRDARAKLEAAKQRTAELELRESELASNLKVTESRLTKTQDKLATALADEETAEDNLKKLKKRLEDHENRLRTLADNHAKIVGEIADSKASLDRLRDEADAEEKRRDTAVTAREEAEEARDTAVKERKEAEKALAIVDRQFDQRAQDRDRVRKEATAEAAAMDVAFPAIRAGLVAAEEPIGVFREGLRGEPEERRAVLDDLGQHRSAWAIEVWEWVRNFSQIVQAVFGGMKPTPAPDDLPGFSRDLTPGP